MNAVEAVAKALGDTSDVCRDRQRYRVIPAKCFIADIEMKNRIRISNCSDEGKLYDLHHKCCLRVQIDAFLKSIKQFANR